MSRRSIALAVAVVALAAAALALAFRAPPGLTASFFDNPELAGEPILELRDRDVSLTLRSRLYPFRNRHYSIRWTGAMLVERAGDHVFTTRSDDGSRLWVDGQLVVDNGGMHGARERRGSAHLAPGLHTLRIEYVQGGADASFAASWQAPGAEARPLAEAPLLARAPGSMLRYRLGRTATLVLAALAVAGAFALGMRAVRARAWRGVERRTWRLAAFFAVAVVGLHLGLARLTPQTTFYTRFFLEQPTHGRTDSWAPMQHAVRILSEEPTPRVYRRLFFDEHVKFQYPPTSLLLLEPVRDWSPERLALAANLGSWCLVWLVALALERIYSLALALYAGHAPPRGADRVVRGALAIGFTLGFYPIVRAWWGGQIQTLLLALFALALWAWLVRRRGAAGVLIGLICVIKPQLGLLALWGGLRREWRFAAGLLGTAGGIGLVSIARYGWTNHLDYLEVLSYIARQGESYAPNQSVNGILHRLLRNGNNLYWVGDRFAPYHPWVHAITMATTLALIGGALFWRRPRAAAGAARPDDRVLTLDLLVAALSFTMASPVAWQHHYNVLLPMLAVALAAALGGARQVRGAVVALGVALVLVGTYTPLVDRFADTPWNPLQSHLFAGAGIALATLYALRTRWQRQAVEGQALEERGAPAG